VGSRNSQTNPWHASNCEIACCAACATLAEVLHDGEVTGDVARLALDRMTSIRTGSTKLIVSFYLTIIEKFEGGPVGARNTFSSNKRREGCDRRNLRTLLLQIGFLNRTPEAVWLPVWPASIWGST